MNGRLRLDIAHQRHNKQLGVLRKCNAGWLRTEGLSCANVPHAPFSKCTNYRDVRESMLELFDNFSEGELPEWDHHYAFVDRDLNDGSHTVHFGTAEHKRELLHFLRDNLWVRSGVGNLAKRNRFLQYSRAVRPMLPHWSSMAFTLANMNLHEDWVQDMMELIYPGEAAEEEGSDGDADEPPAPAAAAAAPSRGGEEREERAEQEEEEEEEEVVGNNDGARACQSRQGLRAAGEAQDNEERRIPHMCRDVRHSSRYDEFSNKKGLGVVFEICHSRVGRAVQMYFCDIYVPIEIQDAETYKILGPWSQKSALPWFRDMAWGEKQVVLDKVMRIGLGTALAKKIGQSHLLCGEAQELTVEEGQEIVRMAWSFLRLTVAGENDVHQQQYRWVPGERLAGLFGAEEEVDGTLEWGRKIRTGLGGLETLGQTHGWARKLVAELGWPTNSSQRAQLISLSECEWKAAPSLMKKEEGESLESAGSLGCEAAFNSCRDRMRKVGGKCLGEGGIFYTTRCFLNKASTKSEKIQTQPQDRTATTNYDCLPSTIFDSEENKRFSLGNEDPGRILKKTERDQFFHGNPENRMQAPYGSEAMVNSIQTPEKLEERWAAAPFIAGTFVEGPDGALVAVMEVNNFGFFWTAAKRVSHTLVEAESEVVVVEIDFDGGKRHGFTEVTLKTISEHMVVVVEQMCWKLAERRFGEGIKVAGGLEPGAWIWAYTGEKATVLTCSATHGFRGVTSQLLAKVLRLPEAGYEGPVVRGLPNQLSTLRSKLVPGSTEEERDVHTERRKGIEVWNFVVSVIPAGAMRDQEALEEILDDEAEGELQDLEKQEKKRPNRARGGPRGGEAGGGRRRTRGSPSGGDGGVACPGPGVDEGGDTVTGDPPVPTPAPAPVPTPPGSPGGPVPPGAGIPSEEEGLFGAEIPPASPRAARRPTVPLRDGLINADEVKPYLPGGANIWAQELCRRTVEFRMRRDRGPTLERSRTRIWRVPPGTDVAVERRRQLEVLSDQLHWVWDEAALVLKRRARNELAIPAVIAELGRSRSSVGGASASLPPPTSGAAGAGGGSGARL